VNYDCIIIGGGLSALTCGIKCREEGLSTLIISNGMNSLHFSSGSIDLFGYNSKGEILKNGFDYIKKLKDSNPNHPYSKIGIKTIEESLMFFKDEIKKDNLNLYNNNNENHFHFTNMGIMKPTFLSQETVYSPKLEDEIKNKSKIAILNFEGYRDFYPEIAYEQLKKNPIFKNTEIITNTIELPHYSKTDKNMHEFRSIDFARIFDNERYLPRIANDIKKAAGDAKIVSLPAFLSINNYKEIHKRLEKLTGLSIYEIPSLPPSILGMRLDDSLRNRFAELGGVYSISNKVVGGTIEKSSLKEIHTENYRDVKLSAKYYVLSTGSFFSGGLKSSFNKLEEPIFNLKFYGNQKREKWYSKNFFDKKSHAFLEYGVETNKNLNPFEQNNKPLKNLFCTGSMLSHYNPIKEASGGGVAIATGYFVAKKIIKKVKG